MSDGFRRAMAPLIAVGVALPIAMISGCSHTGPELASYSSDGQKIEVEVPGQAGTPRFTAVPALS